MQSGYELAAVCECVSLAFQWLVFYLQPRPSVQEYGEGEHDLYGGDARVSGWPTLSGARSDGLCGGPTLGTRGDGLFQPGWV